MVMRALLIFGAFYCNPYIYYRVKRLLKKLSALRKKAARQTQMNASAEKKRF